MLSAQRELGKPVLFVHSAAFIESPLGADVKRHLCTRPFFSGRLTKCSCELVAMGHQSLQGRGPHAVAASASPAGLLKYRALGLTPRVCDSVSLG